MSGKCEINLNIITAIGLGTGLNSALSVLGASVLKSAFPSLMKNTTYGDYAAIGATSGALITTFIIYWSEAFFRFLYNRLYEPVSHLGQTVKSSLIFGLIAVAAYSIPVSLMTLALLKASDIQKTLLSGLVGLGLPTAALAVSCFSVVGIARLIRGRPFSHYTLDEDDSLPPSYGTLPSNNPTSVTVIASVTTETKINVDTPPVDNKTEKTQPLLDKKDPSNLTL